MPLSVGVVNTGWWADAMYLPALTAHPRAEVVAVCGRGREKAEAFAEKWGVPRVFTDYREMMASGVCDMVVVASHPDTHYEISMAALKQGLHVLCEKPMAVTVEEAEEMAALAREKGGHTLIPFTYRFLPHARFIKQLIDEGYVGDPYHLNLRFYHAFGREAGYNWVWDADRMGGGDVANLAAHQIYLALWYFGPIVSVSAELNCTVDRGEVNSEGKPYTQADDNGVLSVRFQNGALGSIHYSSVAYEKSCFDHQHFMEFHGSAGTLYHLNDFVSRQETRGAQEGDNQLQLLTLPDAVWGQAHHPIVHESYKAVFRKDAYMVGEFIDQILGYPIKSRTPLPTFEDGLAVQKVIVAAMESSAIGRRVEIVN